MLSNCTKTWLSYPSPSPLLSSLSPRFVLLNGLNFHTTCYGEISSEACAANYRIYASATRSRAALPPPSPPRLPHPVISLSAIHSCPAQFSPVPQGKWLFLRGKEGHTAKHCASLTHQQHQHQQQQSPRLPSLKPSCLPIKRLPHVPGCAWIPRVPWRTRVARPWCLSEYPAYRRRSK